MTEKTATLLATITNAAIDFGARRGVCRQRLLRAARVEAAQLERLHARVTRSADAAVWRVLMDCFGPTGTGLEFASEAPGPRAYGAVVLRDMTSATFGEALRRHSVHHRVLKDDVAALYAEDRDSAVVELRTGTGKLNCAPAIAEAALAPYAIHARAWTGHDVDPLEVRFEHARPRNLDAYERVFACPVLFAQSSTSIRFARDVLDLPLRDALPEVCEFLEHELAVALSRLIGLDVVGSVRSAIVEGLERGDVGAGAIAKRLGIGVRTLQRRLERERVGYRDLVDGARRERALALLDDLELPLPAISDRLGFSDPRAFRRAFARWTGLSPDRYRRSRSSPPPAR